MQGSQCSGHGLVGTYSLHFLDQRVKWDIDKVIQTVFYQHEIQNRS